MTVERFDVVIVGGGIVGLATAYQLLGSRPDLRIGILEKEAELATHQSGHNSGVLHAGLYYAPGSLKARLCREGKALIAEFAERHGIPFERCGKLVVALDAGELPRLAALRDRAVANRVPGLEEVGPERIREIEPEAAGVRGLGAPKPEPSTSDESPSPPPRSCASAARRSTLGGRLPASMSGLPRPS